MPIAFKKNAIIDDYQRLVIKTWFEPLTGSDVFTVSRGHSLPIDQLRVIADLADDNGVDTGIVYPEFNPTDVYERVKIEFEGKMLEVYAWWRTWGELLNRGVIVNPPLAAYVPFNYILEDGTNKKGDLIQASPHIVLPTESAKVKPCPIDWSQRINRGMANETSDIQRVTDFCHQAKLNGAPVRNIKVEKKNGCVHNDLEKEK